MVFLLCAPAGRGAGSQTLRGQVPAAVANLQPMGPLANTNRLNLAMGFPLRHRAALIHLLRQIYDPASPRYHHYLTPAQFTEQFGPAEADYQAVIAFAEAHGLTVSGTHPNRLLLDVSGAVADIERALHVKMQVYQHPTEARTFFAPDSEPSLDLATPLLGVSGLDNYVVPHPCLRPIVLEQAKTAQTGSAPGGAYLGNDFRAAYVPGVMMTGAGQTVGLVEFNSGYYQSDITAYETLAGLPNVPVSAVLLDGYNGGPGDLLNGNAEVSLDIEMAISMAPGLTGVLVYEGSITDDILNRIATDNLASQIGASWLYPIDTNTDSIFLEFAAQGQSFFNASGDGDAYSGAIPTPADDPNITIVGGTTLTTSGPGGVWVSEAVWNWDIEFGPDYDGQGSSGGISTVYPIPSWQTNINMTANQGSATMRNLPDVALAADDIYVMYGGGQARAFGGTSCASPLWAAFTALVNQQALISGQPTVGFINPALDTIGSGQNYTLCFHDITNGNNTWSGSPARFYAVAGYDLCTGWGTPNGQNLINALANPEGILITPATGFASLGFVGGPFNITNETFSLINIGTNSLDWSLAGTSTWLNASPAGGTLSGGAATNVTVSLDSNDYSLTSGDYTATVWFTDLNDGVAQSRQFSLSLVVPIVITAGPANQMLMAGSTATFSVAVSGAGPLTYQWQFNGTNLPNGIITTVAGGGNGGLGDGGLATNASLNGPSDVAVDASGNLFIVDSGNNVIRKAGTNGIMTTVAGNYSTGGSYGGDGGPATNASLNDPLGAAVDACGNLFIADTYNNVIRKVDTNGIITTVAGNHKTGGSYGGDGNPATNASLSYPCGAVVDASGNLFIADTGNNIIRKVDTNGIITTVAGNYSTGGSYGGAGGPATDASLNNPSAAAVDASGNLFIADTDNQLIRKVDTNGIITTVAGNGSYGYSGDGGPATNASLNYPYGVAVDAFGNLLIADSGNNVIRKVDTGGFIATVAGNGTQGYSGDNGMATNAGLNYPCGVAVDDSGNLFVADTGNNVIREVVFFASYPTLALCNLTTNNAGNYTVIITGPYGSIASAPAALAVILPPEPASQAVWSGGTATFSVAVSGAGPFSYQWQFNGAGLPNDTDFSDATNATLVLNSTTTNDTGNYTVIITGPYGSVTSSIVKLTVASSPIVYQIACNADGSVTLNLLTAPMISSRLLAAANLAPADWQPICTNVAGENGAWQFTDTNTSQHPIRFYRSSTP
jgi:sugar lactone lactonase YvrE